MIERGRYLAKIGGCNDCHTPGYPQSGGKVPGEGLARRRRRRLEGDWGTTYPANLRTVLQTR